MADQTGSAHAESPGSATKPENRFSEHQWYMRPSDGKLVPLVIQSFEDPQILPETSRWTRMGKPLSQVPSLIRVSNWIGAPILEVGSGKRVYTYASVGAALLRLILAWPLMFILVTSLEFMRPVTSPQYQTVQFDNTLGLDHAASGSGMMPQSSYLIPATVPSPQAGPAATGRQSYLDDIRLDSSLSPPPSTRSDPSRRHNAVPASLRPRYLCFVQDFEKGLIETMKVSDFIERHGDHVDIEFVFISYTRMQFRVGTDEELEKFEYPNEETRAANKEVARKDRETLMRWGIDAAKHAGKKAFWLDFECVRNEDGVARSTSSSDDVYRICDIVRAAHSMIIAIGPPASEKVDSILAGGDFPAYSPEVVTPWLRQWGSRLWTLPELLLCPSEYRIKLYALGDSAEPIALAKRNFAERAWDDAEAVKELVNHYEGSAVLTQLNLIEIALACFSRRKTDQFSQGDIAYAIMGLLPHRHRPRVNQVDSGFQAFARLSLANDGEFLERLICLLPPGTDAPWYDIRDHWKANPSDIHPSTQVSDVLDGDTIVLDGVQGAMIQWDNIDVPNTTYGLTKSFLGLFFVQFYLICAIFPKFFAIPFLIIQSMNKGDEILSILVKPALGVIAAFASVAPMILVCSRKTVSESTNARLLGIEGFVDAGEIEKQIWGFNHGSLKLISTPEEYHDSEAAITPEAQGRHAFTLVDTWMMTVTHIHCRSPPVAMFVCGHETGMQRALLCSYDWKSNTFCRQTVLRVGTRVLDQMRRVERIRFSLTSRPTDDRTNRVDSGARLAEQDTEAPPTDTTETPLTMLSDNSRSWMIELLFFFVFCLALELYAAGSAAGYYRRQEVIWLYFGSFSAIQVPAYFLLTRLPIIRVFPMGKGSGMIDGFLLAILVALTWSWFPSKKVPVRILLWMLIGRQAFLLAGAYAEVLGSAADFIILVLYVILCFLLSTFGSFIVGRPNEVPWLAGHQKVFFTRRAATGKFSLHTIHNIWQQRETSYMRYSQPIIVLCISIMSAPVTRLTTTPPPFGYKWDNFIALLMGLIIAVLLAKFPASSGRVTIDLVNDLFQDFNLARRHWNPLDILSRGICWQCDLKLHPFRVE
ncbi:Fc.00g080920.m01.CDS01 [Cosmosporella sp. VM-42]